MRKASMIALSLLAGCSYFRWSGTGSDSKVFPLRAATSDELHPLPQTTGAADASAPSAPDTVQHVRKRINIPPTPPEQAATAMYYSDLGPNSIDVSGYPTMIRRQYKTYAQICARCHSLARSINGPVASRTWWEFYILGMRARASWHGAPLDKGDVRAVLDFLDYDAKIRKVEGAREFDELTEELKLRFVRLMDDRVERLQKSRTLGR